MGAAEEEITQWPRVDVLVLNYNGRQWLEGCFSSLRATDYPNYRVVLVDNASTDDSVAYTRAHFPEVAVFQTGANAGFSRAYNLAVAASDADYVVLLNNDVKVTPGWLRPQIAHLEAHPQLAAVQPRIRSMQQPEYFEYAGASGGFMDVYGFPFLRGRVFDTIEKDEGQYADIVPVFWTSGAALTARRSAYLAVQGMDEDFVHHMEEIDMCWRWLLRGYDLAVVPAAIVYHHAGATISPHSYRKVYWNHRNSVFMLLKNYAGRSLWRYLPGRLMLDVMVTGWALTRGEGFRIRAVVAAWWWILRHLGTIRRKRRLVQQQRITPENAILQRLYPHSIAIRYFLRGRKTYKALMDAVSS